MPNQTLLSLRGGVADVAIPRIEVQSPFFRQPGRMGGLPHQCAHWFAMTRFLCRPLVMVTFPRGEGNAPLGAAVLFGDFFVSNFRGAGIQYFGENNGKKILALRGGMMYCFTRNTTGKGGKT